MRGINLKMEIDTKGLKLGHRYCIRVGDGNRSEIYTIANASDEYSKPQWTMLVGDPHESVAWRTDSQQMYVDVWRQYPNPKFDFEPKSYEHQEWLIADMDVTTFRLNNPLFARACLDWPHGNTWSGGTVPFSEGDQHQYAYTIEEYQFKYNERDVQWTVRRNDDSNDFKEFVLRLSV